MLFRYASFAVALMWFGGAAALCPTDSRQPEIVAQLQNEGYQVTQEYYIEAGCGYSGGGSVLTCTNNYKKMVDSQGRTALVTCDQRMDIKARDGFFIGGDGQDLYKISPAFDRLGDVRVDVTSWQWRDPRDRATWKDLSFTTAKDAYNESRFLQAMDSLGLGLSRVANPETCLSQPVSRYISVRDAFITFTDPNEYNNKVRDFRVQCAGEYTSVYGMDLDRSCQEQIPLPDWRTDRIPDSNCYSFVKSGSSYFRKMQLECRESSKKMLLACSRQKGVYPINREGGSVLDILVLRDNVSKSDLESVPTSMSLKSGVLQLKNESSFTLEIRGVASPTRAELSPGDMVKISAVPGGYIDITPYSSKSYRIWFK